MKSLILLFTSLSSIAFAGGSVGTMERIINGKYTLGTPEIIFNYGQNQNQILLGYGSLVNNQWQIERIKLPLNLVHIDPAIAKALSESAVTQTWAQIK
jgi:hypothetical protein